MTLKKAKLPTQCIVTKCGWALYDKQTAKKNECGAIKDPAAMWKSGNCFAYQSTLEDVLKIEEAVKTYESYF